MSSSTSVRASAQDPLNKPIDPADLGPYLVTDSYGRGENTILTDDEISCYNADPDQFAAEHFGFSTVDEYREWVACNNAALCSERAKSGKLCSNSIGMTYRPEDWRTRHRSAPCFLHAKKEAQS
jgi:hypothetical protein